MYSDFSNFSVVLAQSKVGRFWQKLYPYRTSLSRVTSQEIKGKSLFIREILHVDLTCVQTLRK